MMSTEEQFDVTLNWHDLQESIILSPPRLPPPPPLPLHAKTVNTKCVPNAFEQLLDSKEEVSRACKRFLGFKIHQNNCIIAYNTKTESVLQDGPMCGIVALQMAAQIVSPNSQVTAVHAFEEAKILGYSLQGEMFSAENMGKLAQRLLNCKVSVINNGLLDKRNVIKNLLLGNPILTPYDADCNHEPCCKRGHKAHWATLTGVVFLLPTVPPPSTCERDVTITTLYHGTQVMDIEETLNWIDSGEVYVVARQGKSIWLGLWHYEELLRSNFNLVELDPNRSRENFNYIVPQGGLEEGLCRKIVLLERS